MGMPEPGQFQLPAVMGRVECPKYNWQKMDAFERTGVNIMDAVGAKNAVFGGLFGLFIFALAIVLFREKLGKILLGQLSENKTGRKPPYDVRRR